MSVSLVGKIGVSYYFSCAPAGTAVPVQPLQSSQSAAELPVGGAASQGAELCRLL